MCEVGWGNGGDTTDGRKRGGGREGEGGERDVDEDGERSKLRRCGGFLPRTGALVRDTSTLLLLYP